MMFSIIIPCYNSEKTLARTLDSLCVQRDLIKDVLLIDDGSRDASKQVLDSYQDQLPIHYHYQDNQGPSVARNAGISLATGDYTVFLDSDDTLAPGILSAYRDMFIQDPGLDILIAGTRSVHATKLSDKLPPVVQGSGESLLLRLWFGNLGANIGAYAYKTNSLKSLRFPTDIKHGEDIVFISHLFIHKKIASLPEIAVNVYHHAGSLRHQHSSYFQEADKMVDLLFDPTIIPAQYMAYKNRYRAKRLLALAAKAAKSGQNELAKDWFVKAIKVDVKSLFQVKSLKTMMRISWI